MKLQMQARMLKLRLFIRVAHLPHRAEIGVRGEVDPRILFVFDPGDNSELLRCF